MTGYNPKLDHVNVVVHTHVGRFCQIVLKILSGNQILTSFKGLNSITILRKMLGNNPKLGLVNVDVHTKLGQILSLLSQDTERKPNVHGMTEGQDESSMRPHFRKRGYKTLLSKTFLNRDFLYKNLKEGAKYLTNYNC